MRIFYIIGIAILIQSCASYKSTSFDLKQQQYINYKENLSIKLKGNYMPMSLRGFEDKLNEICVEDGANNVIELPSSIDMHFHDDFDLVEVFYDYDHRQVVLITRLNNHIEITGEKAKKELLALISQPILDKYNNALVLRYSEKEGYTNLSFSKSNTENIVNIQLVPIKPRVSTHQLYFIIFSSPEISWQTLETSSIEMLSTLKFSSYTEAQRYEN